MATLIQMSGENACGCCSPICPEPIIVWEGKSDCRKASRFIDGAYDSVSNPEFKYRRFVSTVQTDYNHSADESSGGTTQTRSKTGQKVETLEQIVNDSIVHCGELSADVTVNYSYTGQVITNFHQQYTTVGFTGITQTFTTDKITTDTYTSVRLSPTSFETTLTSVEVTTSSVVTRNASGEPIPSNPDTSTTSTDTDTFVNTTNLSFGQPLASRKSVDVEAGDAGSINGIATTTYQMFDPILEGDLHGEIALGDWLPSSKGNSLKKVSFTQVYFNGALSPVVSSAEHNTYRFFVDFEAMASWWYGTYFAIKYKLKTTVDGEAPTFSDDLTHEFEKDVSSFVEIPVPLVDSEVEVELLAHKCYHSAKWSKF